jgi:hypothetical protein
MNINSKVFEKVRNVCSVRYLQRLVLPMSGKETTHLSKSRRRPTKQRVSVVVALIQAIERSDIQFSKYVRATGFGTIFLTIMLCVMPDVARLIL